MRSRDETLRTIEGGSFEVCVIGGGATGAACALDAQLRGLKTVLVDAGDFAGATSSKSTKIIHGGVRYLEEAVKDLDPAEYHVVNPNPVAGIEEGTALRVESGVATVVGGGRVKLFRRGRPPQWFASGERLEI